MENAILTEKMEAGKPYATPALSLLLFAATALGLYAAPVALGATWSVADGVGAVGGTGGVSLSAATALDRLETAEGTDAVISGDGSLAFASGQMATNFLRSGTSLVLDVPVSAPGGFAVVNDALATIRNSSDSSAVLQVNSDTVVLANESLDDWDVLYGLATGADMGNYKGWRYEVRYPVRTADSYTVQLQIVTDEYLNCVKLELKQAGADIVARVKYVKYANKSPDIRDFDTSGTERSVATSANGAGYGVYGLVFRRRPVGERKLELRHAPDGMNALTVDGNTVLVANGAGARFSGVATVDGTLVVTNDLCTAFDNTFAGEGGTLRLLGHRGDVHQKAEMLVVEQTLSSIWVTVAPGRSLMAVTNISINKMTGPINDSVAATDRWVCCFTNDGFVARGQAQAVDGAWLKSVLFELRQYGTNVQVRTLGGRYSSKSTPYGTDLFALTDLVNPPGKYQYSGGGYGISKFTLFFSDLDRTDVDLSRAVLRTLNAKSTATGAEIVQESGFADVTHLNGLPASGRYRVLGGTLRLSASGASISSGISEGKTKIFVKDGVLEQGNEAVFGLENQEIELDGSELLLGLTCGYGGGDAKVYVNSIVLTNGSKITGASARVGYNQDAYWTVAGTGVSRVEYCVAFAAASSERIFTLDVADTTGDGQADFVLARGVKPYEYLTTYANGTIVKKGVGTVALYGSGVNAWTKPLRIQAGTLLVSAQQIRKSGWNCPVTFDGGALASVAYVTNSFGAVKLTADAALALGAGAGFAFDAPASATDWPETVKMEITGDELQTGATTSVRIGTSACLSAAQLRTIRYNDRRVTQDADGYLVLLPKQGFVLVVR